MSTMEKEIAIRIQRIRMDQGLTQAELGKLADIPYQTICIIETGTRLPSTNNLIKISKALQVPLSALQPYELDPYAEIPDDILPLISRMKELPEKERRKAQQVLIATLTALTATFTST